MTHRINELTNNLLVFFDKINASKKTKINTLNFLKALIDMDPLKLTEFELSFKIQKDGSISDEIRFLNLDGKGYSFSSPDLYLQRLKLFRKIVKKKINNPQIDELFSALNIVASTPLDLYFGTDIKNNTQLFAFWLILGGVSPDGQINFSPFSKEILKRIFLNLNIKPAFSLKIKDVLNLGFDISNHDFFYKVYYMLSKKGKNFSGEIKNICQILKNDYRYWFFASERYNVKENKCQRKKLFLEFLDVLNTQDKKTKKVLDKLLTLNDYQYNNSDLFEIFSSLKGRIVLVSFEENDILTFYIRLL